MNNRETELRNRQIWSQLGDHYWATRSERQRWVHLHMLYPCLASLTQENESILDFGCGDGSFSRYLLNAYPQISVRAYDISPIMLQLARQVVGDSVVLERLPSEMRFDTIVLNMVLQAIREPEPVLRSLCDHLHDGGRIVLSVPHPAFSLLTSHHRTTKRRIVGDHQCEGIYRYIHEDYEEVYWDDTEHNTSFLYNKTFSTYSTLFGSTGFFIENMIEPIPEESGQAEEDLFRLHSSIPNFLIYVLKKRNDTV